MTSGEPSDAAFRVADRIRTAEPWEIFAERIRRFELHLNGRAVELVRGPVGLEGYGVRVLRSRDGQTGAGFQASTDFSTEGIRATVSDAESVAGHSEFPAKRVELPNGSGAASADIEVVDRALWDDPLGSIERYVDRLLHGFDQRKDVVPSFGSVRATLAEVSIANSAGARRAYRHTSVDFEFAVKAIGGAEGPAPGEYWVNSTGRRLEPDRLPAQIEEWCRYARDVRRAVPPPTGELSVGLPPGVLAGILPVVLGYRFTGAARLRKLSPALGSRIAADGVTLRDDGVHPWAANSAPFDGEGSPRAAHALITSGLATELLYDSLHAGAFDAASTASAGRGILPGGYADWRQFVYAPRVTGSTVVVAEGKGGSDAELIESVDDGVWVQQIGWAFPDEISGAFGGEIRIGYHIRHGKLAEPVRGGTVGGMVLSPPGQPSLLANVQGIGSRAELADYVVTPSLLVRPLVVAGAEGDGATSR